MQTVLVDIPLWIGFVIALLACWGMTICGLPGNWLILVVSIAVTLLAPAEARFVISPLALALLLLLALLGEFAEFAAGSVATKRAGGTRRGAVGAIVGGFLGAISGAIVGLPIPLVGSAVAALVGGAVGALAGAVVGESHTQDLAASWKIGQAAFWGRLGGTLAKAALGGVMVVVAALAAWF